MGRAQRQARTANELVSRTENVTTATREEEIFDPINAQAAPAKAAVIGTSGSWYHGWRLPKPATTMKRIMAVSHHWKRPEYFDRGPMNKPISAMIERIGERADV